MGDLEKANCEDMLKNRSVLDMSWDISTVSVPSRSRKSEPVNLLENVQGHLVPGVYNG